VGISSPTVVHELHSSRYAKRNCKNAAIGKALEINDRENKKLARFQELPVSRELTGENVPMARGNLELFESHSQVGGKFRLVEMRSQTGSSGVAPFEEPHLDPPEYR
jgi:hypothetical protein